MNNPREPKVILADLDGTLADSLTVLRRAYERFLQTYGLEPDDAEFDSLNGPPLREVVRHLKVSRALCDDEERLFAKYSDALDRAYDGVVPSPGALQLVESAKRHGCAVGVVTSNTRQRTRAWLESVGLIDKIDVIVAGEDVGKGKPHPEPYRYACIRTTGDPTQIVAIEDSPQGAESALAAGLRTLVLGQSVEGWPRGAELIHSLLHAVEILWR